MGKLILVLGLAVCLFIPMAVEASEYIGDYCFLIGGSQLAVFSVSFIGLDQSGYEMYIYAGRIPSLQNAINGNCIEVYVGMARQYVCNMLLIGTAFTGTYVVSMDFDTLVGKLWGTEEFYDSNTKTFTKSHLSELPFTPITCPASW